MRVAEALALRADLQRRLEQLMQRLVKNAGKGTQLGLALSRTDSGRLSS